MAQNRASGWRVCEESAVGRLARFFPEAVPVRLAVTVNRKLGGYSESEATVIEFGTPREALFACQMPLEFAERVRLHNADCSFEAEACVVALQFHDGQTAAAARFVQEMPHWAAQL